MMQITINIPDNLPPANVKQEVSESEAKLKRLKPIHKAKNQQTILQIIKTCAGLPTLDARTPGEILGYDKDVTGLWGINSSGCRFFGIDCHFIGRAGSGLYCKTTD